VNFSVSKIRDSTAEVRSLRLVSWNIEKGKRWDRLVTCLGVEEIRTADILCLNEVDEGMARSQNRRVADELAIRLGMRSLFGPAYHELTKGIGEERLAPGENELGIQGNAILTRLPVLHERNVRLPVCHDPSGSEERREGGRCALVVELDCGGGRSLTVANTHLEVLTTTECRSCQMTFLLSKLGDGPAVLAGDLNTNTFDRGTRWHTFISVLRLLHPDSGTAVMQPWRYEPLFEDLKRAGFVWETFNDDQPTCYADLESLEDRKYVPRILQNYILRRTHRLPLKLDWIAGRFVRPMTTGRTLTNLPAEPSDHRPIMCDIEIV
jgi:endonuclease/exonuclease/phosphatase family metal-dependent hydrolase